MTNFLKLPTWDDDGHILTVVETPRGSTCKLDFDPDLGVFTLAKPLMAGLSYSFEALYPLDDGSGRRSARCSHHSRRQDLSRRRPEVQAGRRTRGRADEW